VAKMMFQSSFIAAMLQMKTTVTSVRLPMLRSELKLFLEKLFGETK
jgi:hypothetical protein